MAKEDDLEPFSDEDLRTELDRRWIQRDNDKILTGGDLAGAIRSFLKLDQPARAVALGTRYAGDTLSPHGSALHVRDILLLHNALVKYEKTTNTEPKNIFQ